MKLAFTCDIQHCSEVFLGNQSREDGVTSIGSVTDWSGAAKPTPRVYKCVMNLVTYYINPR